MPAWGEAKDAKGRDKVTKVREMEAIVQQKERDQRKAEELAESQRQPNVRNRLNTRYGIGNGATTQLAVAAGGGAVVVAGGGGGCHLSLPKAERREKTKEEVEKLRKRLEDIDAKNTHTLEQYVFRDNPFGRKDPQTGQLIEESKYFSGKGSVADAKENLIQLRLNTTGWLARKAMQQREKAAQEAEAKRERDKSADVLTAASVGDHEQLKKLLNDELQKFNGSYLRLQFGHAAVSS